MTRAIDASDHTFIKYGEEKDPKNIKKVDGRWQVTNSKGIIVYEY